VGIDQRGQQLRGQVPHAQAGEEQRRVALEHGVDQRAPALVERAAPQGPDRLAQLRIGEPAGRALDAVAVLVDRRDRHRAHGQQRADVRGQPGKGLVPGWVGRRDRVG
jgi:hypothetical protein